MLFATAKLALASELALPMEYYLPKSKCFGGDDGAKFQCDRPHEHERIIIAAPTDGVNRFMRRAARALSAVAKASGLHSLSVRRLNEAVRAIEEANGRLGLPQHETSLGFCNAVPRSTFLRSAEIEKLFDV